jgi:hypothetical protein
MISKNEIEHTLVLKFKCCKKKQSVKIKNDNINVSFTDCLEPNSHSKVSYKVLCASCNKYHEIIFYED